MLASEAVRLLAYEALCPTAARVSDGPYPTLAGANVYDSRAIALSDVDATRDYTPSISLYTPESGSTSRGAGSSWIDREADCALDVVSELVIITRGDDGEDYAVPMAEGDGLARLVLATLAAQVRQTLMLMQSGAAWRKLVHEVKDVEFKTVALPQYGLQVQRLVSRYHLTIVHDDVITTENGLPEPLRSVAASLPAQSYAKAKLAELAAILTGETLADLREIHGQTPEGAAFGPSFPLPDPPSGG